MVNPETEGLVSSLLGDTQFDIEFNGYLSNHVKHAIVALAGLDAPASRIREYWDFYTKLTPYGLTLEPAQPLDNKVVYTEENWLESLGKKVHFTELCQFFDERERELGTEGVLQRFAPTLLPGCAGALTHGVIHLGWALDAGSRRMLIEGLAYMTFSYLPAHPERFVHKGHQDASPIQSLLRITDAWVGQDLTEWVAGVKADPKYCEAADFHMELVASGFQWQVSKVLEEGHPLLYTLPSWLDDVEVSTILEELYKLVTLLYLVSAGQPETPGQHGNFVALHLITSLWGVEHIAARLPDDQQRQALKCFWVVALALLFTSGAGFPSRTSLEGIEGKFRKAIDESPTPMEEGEDWDALVQLGMAEEEEHNIKLVYVEHELWRRYAKWSGFRVAASSFTLTPDVGPGRTAFSD